MQRKAARRGIMFVVCFLCFCGLWAWGTESGPQGLLLSFEGDASTSQTFTWTNETSLQQYVEYVTQEAYDQSGFEDAIRVEASCSDISLDGSGYWHYEATATMLTPGTTYYYRVGNGEQWSSPAYFTTLDPQAEQVSFVYMGDIQIDQQMEEEYTLWGALAQAAYKKAPDLAFGILGGDIVESGISTAQFQCFLENASPVFSKVPLFATNGNHESNFPSGKPELYLDTFAFPRNGPQGFEEEFYSFHYGPCHVIVLNSWVFSGEQALTEEDFAEIAAWIKADLSSSNATWQIVVTHLPPYAVHSDQNAAAVKENWVPLFEQYGVDLVFVGHQHVYARSYPMYENQINYEKGIPYIMGNAGQKYYSSADESLMERVIYNTATYQLVRIDGDSLTVQTFDLEGNELDFCSVTPREKETQTVSFSDVKEDAWYAKAVQHVTERHLVEPISETVFGPDAPMTRAAMVSALYQLAGQPEVGSSTPFTDVAGEPYETAVAWAYENGISIGTAATRFSPEQPITREEAATLLWRYTDHIGQDVSSGADLYMYPDGENCSIWAKDAMAWAVEKKVIQGRTYGSIAPQGVLTRAEAAQMLLNYEEGHK